jgi:hypothetical protein
MARPIPRVEPVMTATFPFMSNKVMRFSLMLFVSAKQSLKISTISPRHCEEPLRRSNPVLGAHWIASLRSQ